MSPRLSCDAKALAHTYFSENRRLDVEPKRLTVRGRRALQELVIKDRLRLVQFGKTLIYYRIGGVDDCSEWAYRNESKCGWPIFIEG